MEISLRDQALLSCRWLLSQLNRDPSTPTHGCFDRRHWAWKLVDFPEATFQRNLYPLCWFMDQPEAKDTKSLLEGIKAGLMYAKDIQHRNGSFDQAYPNENSYGATAFLLVDLISAFVQIEPHFTEEERADIRECLFRSADFLYRASERHGFITNHLAGAALALYKSSYIFDDNRYISKANEILDKIITNQSEEGWFPEYGGADPGYQTLCMYYLAQIFEKEHSDDLKKGIEKSLAFLQYFVHPDGSFGGEYGSRRTEIYYPGGIALLSKDFPIAAEMHAFMSESIRNGRTVTLVDIDIGNTAPLLANTIMAVSIEPLERENPILPYQQKEQTRFFPAAGLAAVVAPDYYAVLGASNGGVLKVFGKKKKQLVFDDCGVLGETTAGRAISTQATNLLNPVEWGEKEVAVSSPFSIIPAQTPTPLKFLLLRIANLTIMRCKLLNEVIKKMLVRMLIGKKTFLPINRDRKIKFDHSSIHIVDRITKSSMISLKELREGIKFSSIHMASARYYSPAVQSSADPISFDLDRLHRTGVTERSITIDFTDGPKVTHE